jgi:hypothetical protein
MITCMKHKYTKIRSRLKIKQEVLGRTNRLLSFRYILSILYDTDGIENTASNIFLLFHVYSLSREVLTEPLSRNGRLLWLHYSAFQALGETRRQQSDLISPL